MGRRGECFKSAKNEKRFSHRAHKGTEKPQKALKTVTLAGTTQENRNKVSV
jgi:hypothetical protein